MMKKIAILLIFCMTIPLLLFAEENIETDSQAWALYSEALEFLVQGEKKKALELFREFIATYPDSPLMPKVEEFIAIIENARDHSAIVPYYITQLLSTAYISFTIPQFFDVDISTDSYIYGLAGIAGVGAGLASAWYLTHDADMGPGRELWIENAMLLTLSNYNLIWALIMGDGFRYEDKPYLTGQLVLAAGSRLAAYYLTKDEAPSPGRASFFTWSYTWAEFYTWTALTGIVMSEDIQLNSIFGLIIPDIICLGSYFLWDRLDFSFERNGIISIAGLGGILLGACVNLILDSIVPDGDLRVAAGIIMASACTGTILGVVFTSGMKGENDLVEGNTVFQTDNALHFAVSPVPDGKGLQFNVVFSYN